MSLVDDSAELAAKRANMNQRSTSLSADMSTTAPSAASQNFSLSSIQEVPESVDSISVCKEEPNITNKSVGKLADPKGNSTQVRPYFKGNF